MMFGRWIVRAHKWLALAVGVQVLLWVLGGFAMSVMPLDKVRAEHTVAPGPAYQLPLADVLPAERAAAIAGLPGVEEAALVRWPDGPVWRFSSGGTVVVVDALSGLRLPIDAARAEELARAAFAGDAPVTAIEYYAEAPVEYRRDRASWRVSFDDGEGTRLYVDAATGEIGARRNDLWRVYDVFWMLHVMDYSQRERINNPLLITASALALLLVIAGLTLLIMRLQRTVRAALIMRRRAQEASRRYHGPVR
ncbi:MAG: PepSY domain-containing protein [Oceanicaulis sp.]